MMTLRRAFYFAGVYLWLCLKYIGIWCTPFLNTQQTVDEQAQDVALLDDVIRELDEDENLEAR